MTFSGDFQVKRVAIDPAAQLARETLERQILAAVEDGMAQVRQAAREQLKGVTGGMDLFGL